MREWHLEILNLVTFGIYTMIGLEEYLMISATMSEKEIERTLQEYKEDKAKIEKRIKELETEKIKKYLFRR